VARSRQFAAAQYLTLWFSYKMRSPMGYSRHRMLRALSNMASL
jgi:hypothetical protein